MFYSIINVLPWGRQLPKYKRIARISSLGSIIYVIISIFNKNSNFWLFWLVDLLFSVTLSFLFDDDESIFPEKKEPDEQELDIDLLTDLGSMPKKTEPYETNETNETKDPDIKVEDNEPKSGFETKLTSENIAKYVPKKRMGTMGKPRFPQNYI